VECKGDQIVGPSSISLEIEGGKSFGDNAQIISHTLKTIDTSFVPINYTKDMIRNRYNELKLHCQGGYGFVFRIYDDAVAYRFFLQKREEVIVKAEEASFNFASDFKAFIPIMWDYRGGKKFNSSFEALYREINVSQFPADSLAFLPVLVDVGSGRKVVILEADLEDYPGMYLNVNRTHYGFVGVFAEYPVEEELGGFANINLTPTKKS
jgi:alpha-glucosidase